MTRSRFLYREYIFRVHRARRSPISRCSPVPQAVVVFNGQFYPEATAKWVANSAACAWIMHEVGLMPMTRLFTQRGHLSTPSKSPDSFEPDRWRKTPAWMPTWNSACGYSSAWRDRFGQT